MIRKFIVSLASLCFLSIFLLITLFLNKSVNSFTDLNGYIITGISSNTERNSIIINLQNKEKKIIDNNITYNYIFAGNKQKLLSNIGNEIYLYDTYLKSNSLICKVNVADVDIDNIKFINNDYLSFISNDRDIILYNIKSNEQKILATNVMNIYSYSYNNKKLYYSSNNKIYSININTNENEYIIDGNTPIISKNGRILAYYKDTNRNKLIIKDLSDGKIWTINESPNNFVLSPNGNYILMVKQYDDLGILSIFKYLGYKTVIYDYKNKQEMTIIEKCNYNCMVDWI